MDKLAIRRLRIKNNPLNEVTSHKVFRNRKVIDGKGNYLYHEDSIFSDRIFGRIGKCRCGIKREQGICENCQTRVLDPTKMPDFYISFEGILDIPYWDVSFPFAKDKDEATVAKDLLYYRGFLYEGKYYEANLKELDLTQFDVTRVLIGKEALLSMGATETWYYENTHYNLAIPHTSYRPLSPNNKGGYHLGKLNNAYVEILQNKKKLLPYVDLIKVDIFAELGLKKLILQDIEKARLELFGFLAENEKSIVRTELKGQKLTGMARGVITNNFDLAEDTILLGEFFVRSLYPDLYASYTDEHGNTDVNAVNEYLAMHEYYVLVNRQPTIGAKSIMTLRPVFTANNLERYVMGLNPIIFDGYAADTDGDALNVIALYTKVANDEAKKLLPSHNYIEGSNGSIRNTLPEDFVYVMKQAYDKKTILATEIHKTLLGNTDNMDYKIARLSLSKAPRATFMEVYRLLGKAMFTHCYIPNVGDFALAYKDTDEVALSRITDISTFTGNTEDILLSLNKTDANYTEDESKKFMESVISANITDITDSGYFYKKLMSATDDITLIPNSDCHSEGHQIVLPLLDESSYNLYVKNRWIVELDSTTNSYTDFLARTSNMTAIHIRDLFTCMQSADHRTFCAKCAGAFYREHNNAFSPKHLGTYSTLMITEHATQASLDSMNKGTSEKLNKLLETQFDTKKALHYETELVPILRDLIAQIGDIGVESRFYEVALLSRVRHISGDEPGYFRIVPLVTSFLRQKDMFGAFIYRPNMHSFIKLIEAGEVPLTSTKSKLALDDIEC